jgi:hypothetical protein
MKRRNRSIHMRHIVHLTRFVVWRESVGKSGYVTRPHNFRHMREEVNHG